MEVKIGVQQAAREIVLESEQSPDDVMAAVESAVAAGTLLTLTDDKGRRVAVPGDKIAYIELGVPERGRIGFGAV